MPDDDTARVEPHDHNAALRLLSAGTARIASASALRQILSAGMLAITAAVVARTLGPHSFGAYSAGIAAFSLVSAFTDLGFSLYLNREMSKRPEDEAALLGTALPAQAAWTCVPTLILLTLALAAGGTRGAVMLALCPAVLLSSFAVTRQIFAVRFVASPLLVLDVATTLLQCGVMVALALAHAPIVFMALNLTLFSVVVGIVSFILARRLTRFTRPTRAAVAAFVGAALPLGLASVLASVYFTVDMTLLGWLARPRSVGEYAAAVRLLNIVVMFPGFIMGAGIPGLSRASGDKARLTHFTSMLTEWLAVSALPVGVGLAIFARPIVLVVFGSHYLAAAPLVRILMVAASLSLVSNITGIVMMTQGIIGPQIAFNTLSLIVNVTGNILLVPRYGVAASAWLTVVSESIVVSYGVIVLRHKLDYRHLTANVWRPLAAVGVAAGTGIALGTSSGLSMAASTTTFLAGLTVFRAWPKGVSEWLTARFEG